MRFEWTVSGLLTVLLSVACGGTSQEPSSGYLGYGVTSRVPRVESARSSGLGFAQWFGVFELARYIGRELPSARRAARRRHTGGVLGPIAGVRYVTAGKPSVVGDCRLMLALDWAGRTLTRVGIDEVRHSGAYVYCTTSSGRPSLHARGLAIDLHAVRSGANWFDVERDYEHGTGPECDSVTPFLNHVYCRLRQLELFREIITPDHNAEHHDHFSFRDRADSVIGTAHERTVRLESLHRFVGWCHLVK